MRVNNMKQGDKNKEIRRGPRKNRKGMGTGRIETSTTNQRVGFEKDMTRTIKLT